VGYPGGKAEVVKPASPRREGHAKKGGENSEGKAQGFSKRRKRGNAEEKTPKILQTAGRYPVLMGSRRGHHPAVGRI